MAEPDDFDCLRCGACCTAPDGAAGYVRLTSRDLRRLPAVQRAAAERLVPPLLPTRTTAAGTRCASLSGCLGSAVVCTIYDARPGGCRKLRPGSAACKILRERVLDIIDA